MQILAIDFGLKKVGLAIGNDVRDLRENIDLVHSLLLELSDYLGGTK